MKTSYKNRNQKTNMLTTAKYLIEDFRKYNNIDEDSYFVIKYKDGSMLSYPDQADQIKFKNIENIYFSGTDDNGDFKYDFIGTQESYDFLLEGWKNAFDPSDFIPKNPLIVNDMNDYFKMFEA
jgi:hypothetical protein